MNDNQIKDHVWLYHNEITKSPEFTCPCCLRKFIPYLHESKKYCSKSCKNSHLKKRKNNG